MKIGREDMWWGHRAISSRPHSGGPTEEFIYPDSGMHTLAILKASSVTLF